MPVCFSVLMLCLQVAHVFVCARASVLLVGA